MGLQLSTGGLAGFKSDDGGLGTGLSGDVAVGALKDVTGATAAEEANADARKRFAEEKSAADKARKDAQSQSAADQLAKSRSASSARGGISNPSSTGQARFSNLGSDEQDFLGL